MKNQLIDFFKKYKYHFLVWSAYLIYEMSVTWLIFDKSPLLIVYTYYFVFYILLFYFHANVLLKYTLGSSNKLLKFSLVFLILIELLVYVGLKYQFDLIFLRNLDPAAIKGYTFNLTVLSPIIYRFVYFICYSTGYYFLIATHHQRQQVEEMEQQELRNLIQEKEIKNELVLTQNAFLKSQINPDFLINTLNYFYEETIKIAPKAAESIISLSNMMQYALGKEASTGFVKLNKEIELIENFLLLHQARQVHQAQLKLVYTQDILSAWFVPLVLMTLTENMLKHGKLDDPDSPAEIRISYENSILRIETANKESRNSSIPGRGIGLKNIKERLYLAYGEKATFDYHLDSRGYFHTAIVVQNYSIR